MPENVITIFSTVLCCIEGAEKPECCAIRLTQSEVDRLKTLREVCKEHDLFNVSFYANVDWYDGRPTLTFDELGEKFIVLNDEVADDELIFTDKKDPYDSNQNFERLDSESIVVTKHGFYAQGYGKWSGNLVESSLCHFESLEEELAKPGPTPRRDYYGLPDDVSFEDLPKYLNSMCDGLKMYAREMMKRGQDGYSL